MKRLGQDWAPVVGVTVVTLLAAGAVGAVVTSHQTRPTLVANESPVISPSPSPVSTPRPTPVAAGGLIELSAPSANVVWALVNYDALYLSTDRGDHWAKRTLPGDFGVRPSISFVNQSEGWLLAPGSPATQCQEAAAAVWHTTDAGKSWQRLAASGLRTAQCKELVYFADSQHGFVTAWDDNHQPTVYATADGGKTWRASTVPDNPIFVTRPAGFTLRVDWIKSFSGRVYLEASGKQSDPTWPTDFIYTSTNGGGTWSWQQKVPTHELAMVTEQRWLEIDPPGQLDESLNGGQEMHPYQSDLRIDSADAPGQILFADATVGYVSRGGAIQRTTDGGLHWTTVTVPGSPGPTAPPPDVQLSAPSANVVWALVGADGLYRSIDGGTTWAQRPMAPYSGGGGNPVISFVDEALGWALFPGVPSPQCSQASAHLWRTSDAGAHWSLVTEVTDQQQPKTGLPFAQCKDYAVFANPRTGFVAGHDTQLQPLISRTADGGVTWASSRLPNPPGFTTGGGVTLQVVDIRPFGSVVLVVAIYNASAYIFRSNDLGATWTYVPTAQEWANGQVTIVTATHWLNVQARIQTDDAGKTAQPFVTDDREALVGARLTFATTLVGYGAVYGLLYRTTDGGFDWTMVHTPGT